MCMLSNFFAHVVRMKSRVARRARTVMGGDKGARDEGFSRIRILRVVGMSNAARELVERAKKLAAAVN